MIHNLQTNISKHSNKLALFLILLFFVSGVLALPLSGMSFDEGLGNFFFGERYLYYWTHFEEKYLDFKAELPLHAEHSLNLYQSPFRNLPQEFPGIADTASAATMYLFSYGLGWLDPVDGFHLFTVILTSVFLYIFYRFSAHRAGKPTAFFGLLFLASFPRLWGDMQINVKDVPEMAVFGLALMAFWRWNEKPTWKRAILTGIASGAALGIKANALFIPVIIIIGSWPLTRQKLLQHIKSYWAHYLIMAASAGLTYFLSWPYIYTNPANAIRYFEYIASQGGRNASAGWSWQPTEMVVATIPEIMLICLLVGLVWVGYQLLKTQNGYYRYLLIWCLLPIIRISLPPSINFDGIRHFMEFLPAAALLAGAGATAVVRWVTKHRPAFEIPASGVIIIFLVLSTVSNFVNFGAFQYIYFNQLSGGLPGAAAHFGASEATDYWAISYRQGIKWMNENAPVNSALHVPIAGHLVELTAPLWLRPDITVIDEEELSEQKTQGKTIFVMFITRPQFYKPIAEACLNARPKMYQIKVQEIPILHICNW